MILVLIVKSSVKLQDCYNKQRFFCWEQDLNSCLFLYLSSPLHLFSKLLGSQISAGTPRRASPTSSFTFPGKISPLRPSLPSFSPFQAQITGQRTTKQPWKRLKKQNTRVFPSQHPHTQTDR